MRHESSLTERLAIPDLSLVSDEKMDEALDVLRSASLDPDPVNISRMEVGVLRQWRMEQDVKSWKWWAPFAAALVAGFMLAGISLSLLQPSPSREDEQMSVNWPALQAETRPSTQ